MLHLLLLAAVSELQVRVPAAIAAWDFSSAEPFKDSINGYT